MIAAFVDIHTDDDGFAAKLLGKTDELCFRYTCPMLPSWPWFTWTMLQRKGGGQHGIFIGSIKRQCPFLGPSLLAMHLQ